jgi:hypothetical protein
LISCAANQDKWNSTTWKTVQASSIFGSTCIGAYYGYTKGFNFISGVIAVAALAPFFETELGDSVRVSLIDADKKIFECKAPAIGPLGLTYLTTAAYAVGWSVGSATGFCI